MARGCTVCGSADHTRFYCRKKPHKAIKTKTALKRQGKVAKQWVITRETWFRKHPAPFYDCYLRIAPLCPGRMSRSQTTLDHIQSRSRHPELRYALSNLAPACYWCNALKGSKDVEEL